MNLKSLTVQHLARTYWLLQNTYQKSPRRQNPQDSRHNRRPTLRAMAPSKKKTSKSTESIASRLALVVKSGKYSLGYKSALKQMRSGKGECLSFSSPGAGAWGWEGPLADFVLCVVQPSLSWSLETALPSVNLSWNTMPCSQKPLSTTSRARTLRSVLQLESFSGLGALSTVSFTHHTLLTWTCFIASWPSQTKATVIFSLSLRPSAHKRLLEPPLYLHVQYVVWRYSSCPLCSSNTWDLACLLHILALYTLSAYNIENSMLFLSSPSL